MNPSDHLAHLFSQFPGIGPKQAKRFVYYLMKKDSRYIDELQSTILTLRQKSRQCERCFRFFSERHQSDTTSCTLCASPSRDGRKLLIVEKELDVDAIEKTASYDGLYFILGGIIPPLVEKPSDHVRIRELAKRVHDDLEAHSLSEIIFALPVTTDGDATAQYVQKTLEQLVGIKEVSFSALARGLSSGLELEYVDKDTFKSAFERRS